MNYKNTAILIIVIVVLVGGGLSFYYYRNSVTTAPAENVQNSQIKTGVVVEDKKITDNTKPFKIDITYPQIAGVDGFNQEVKAEIDKQLNDFKTYSLENDATVKKADPASYAKYPREYDFTVDYDKGQIDENTASVVLNIYAFEGGAHGTTNFVPINYDVKNKKDIKLADLFSETPNYLQKISDYCIKDLKQQISDRLQDNGDWVKSNGTWINDGAGPTAENYSVFLINKDNPAVSGGILRGRRF